MDVPWVRPQPQPARAARGAGGREEDDAAAQGGERVRGGLDGGLRSVGWLVD